MPAVDPTGLPEGILKKVESILKSSEGVKRASATCALTPIPEPAIVRINNNSLMELDLTCLLLQFVY